MRFDKALIVGCALATGLAALPSAAEDVRIGAMREGSSWYVFAATLEQMLEPQLDGTNVEVIARGGGVANPMVVQNGDAEVALSNVATAVWAANGHEIYGGASAPDIRALVDAGRSREGVEHRFGAVRVALEVDIKTRG